MSSIRCHLTSTYNKKTYFKKKKVLGLTGCKSAEQCCQRERRIACGHKAGESERWSCGRSGRVGNSPLPNENDGRPDHAFASKSGRNQAQEVELQVTIGNSHEVA